MQHDCGKHYDPPIYDWIPRVPEPKVCPRCKVYLHKLVKEVKPPKPKPETIVLPEKKPEKKPVPVKEPAKPKAATGLQGLLITEEDV